MQHNEKRNLINEWYQLYARDVFSILYMMINDYQEAEDLTHDTFVKAYKRLDTFKNKSSPKTWLVRISRNLAVDYLRKRKPIQGAFEIISQKKSNEWIPEDVVQINETDQELYTALKKLKRKYREVLILRKIMEYSVTETADILNWSENKVKVTLHRAMKALENELKQGGFIYGT